jgi:hypothetical protein
MTTDDRPWEEPGCFRFDCEPERGAFLLLLANWSLGCAILAFFMCIPALVSFPLSIAVQLMANRDLPKMGTGLMDPTGEDTTFTARRRARYSLFLSMLSCIAYALVLIAIARQW